MSASPEMLFKKLEALPPQRRVEVEDFMDFLAAKENRGAAWGRLLAIAPALEAAGVPPMSEEEIVAEVKAVRAERRARHAALDVKDRT